MRYRNFTTCCLVTWHQSKNPQDGSCGTDCPHALPCSKPVVIRLDFSCVFPVSGLAHPARQPSRTHPWARHTVLWRTDAHSWPLPIRQTPTWRLPRQLCTNMARAQWQGTIVMPRTYPCAVVVRPSGQSAVVARPSRQSAAAVPPKQSSANVAPLQWQHTTVVQPTCTCAAVAQCSGHGAVVALPRQPYASVAPVQWQSAIVVPPTYTCAIVVQSSGQNATAALPRQALHRRGASLRTWHHCGAVNVHVRRRGATFRAERHRAAAQTFFVRQPGHGVSSRPILEASWRGLQLALRHPP